MFYMMFSTYFVGNTLGGLASLREELEDVRQTTAWQRRQVTKAMIDELQPEVHDGKIDQYEFVLASLLQLGKVSAKDITPIMNKFRSVMTDDGYIVEAEAEKMATLAETDETEAFDMNEAEAGEMMGS